MKGKHQGMAVVFAALLGACAAALVGWQMTGRELESAGKYAADLTGDSSRLVSVQPMPAMEGLACLWEPASATAGWQAPSSVANTARKTLDLSQRKPIRTIRDPYSAFSAVAVDHKHNEVILADENLFQIAVYDRTANTPANAKMTEPKRLISGDKTHIEFQCGVYVDPKSGDIYAVNNDTVDDMVIFSREAKGNVPPTRALHTPHGTFGIAVHEDREELFLTVQHDNAIVVYKKYADGEEPPIRLIQGDKTLLADPHGIAIDDRRGLLYVTNYGATKSYEQARPSRGPAAQPTWPLQDAAPGTGRFYPPSINVYRLDDSGDAAPQRQITGPKTRLNWATGLAIDEERNELLVANDMSDEILVFPLDAVGDTAPIRAMKGPKTLLKNPTGLYLDKVNNEFWVTNFGNRTATVYPRGADGNVAPLRLIRSGPIDNVPMLGNPHPVAYDTKREQILVPN
jgi:DNA-binding beta-propeller fold protein YncE